LEAGLAGTPGGPTPKFIDFPSALRETRTNYSVAIHYLHSNKIAVSVLYFWMYLRDLPDPILLISGSADIRVAMVNHHILIEANSDSDLWKNHRWVSVLQLNNQLILNLPVRINTRPGFNQMPTIP
jgi:hypothetical protein